MQILFLFLQPLSSHLYVLSKGTNSTLYPLGLDHKKAIQSFVLVFSRLEILDAICSTHMYAGSLEKGNRSSRNKPCRRSGLSFLYYKPGIQGRQFKLTSCFQVLSSMALNSRSKEGVPFCRRCMC